MKLLITQLMKKLLILSLTIVVMTAFAEISTAQNCLPPPPGMVAWWGLDELNEDGEYVDLAGGDNNGVPINNPQQVTGVYVNNSIRAGVNKYVEVADAPELNFGTTGSFTIDAWVQFTPGTQTEPVIHKRGNQGGYFLFFDRGGLLGSGPFRLKFQIHGMTFDGPVINVQVGTWIFVSAVVDRSNNIIRLCVGVPGGSLSCTPHSVGALNASSPNPLRIGWWHGNHHAALGIDEVEIFNRALSIAELDGIFQAEMVGKCKLPITGNGCVPPPNTTMVAWYPFDETVGPTAANLATGNTGTHINNPTPISGMVAGALNFDGINDYVESPSTIVTNFGPANTPSFCSTGQQGSYSSCLGDFSIDTWIRLQPNAPAGVMTIVDKRSPTTGQGYHFFVFNGNQLGVQLADPSFTNYLSQILPLTDGMWRHVAVTVKRRSPNDLNTARINFYHNGALLSSLSPPTKAGSLANTSPLRIGTRTAASPLTGWFQGDIDELEIFNRELLDLEVNSIFMAGSSGKCK